MTYIQIMIKIYKTILKKKPCGGILEENDKINIVIHIPGMILHLKFIS